MGAFKDTYDIIKDLLHAAKSVQNKEVVQLAMDLQEKFFELREENQELSDRVKMLSETIDQLKHPDIDESDIEYSPKGFFTLKNDSPKVPYCSFCWKTKRVLAPLAQYFNWGQYKCGGCHSEVTVMTTEGKDISKLSNI